MRVFIVSTGETDEGSSVLAVFSNAVKTWEFVSNRFPNAHNWKQPDRTYWNAYRYEHNWTDQVHIEIWEVR